jgi:3-dehydroquinate dehydratase II
MKILIINGPNLNLTGQREKEIYGNIHFEDYLEILKNLFPDVSISYFQSNIEGEIINCLQNTETDVKGIILNAGGYTHTSVAIGDAVKAIEIPVIEVHLSNILSREEFRHKSFIAPHCTGSIFGFGLDSYRLAISYFLAN